MPLGEAASRDVALFTVSRLASIVEKRRPRQIAGPRIGRRPRVATRIIRTASITLPGADMPSSPIRIGFHGAAGRMGQRLIALAAADGSWKIAAALEHAAHPK